MTRTEIINSFIKKYDYQSYLEIGLGSGLNFTWIHAFDKIGVDPSNEYQYTTYRIPSDEFFNTIQPTLNKKYDIIFVDGLHTAEQTYKDVMNALLHLNQGGTIIMHDCNPPTEGHQKVPQSQRDWNGDVWKAFYKLRTLDWNYDNNKFWNLFTIDTDWGCGVIQNITQDFNFKFKDDNFTIIPYEELTYNFFDKNRKDILNLISIDEFKEYIGK